MARRSRLTQQSELARSFGGRSGFVSEELDARGGPQEQMGRWERAAARLTWDEAGNHYEEYADDDRVRLNRLLPSAEVMLALACVLVFVGAFAGFIAYLALTR